MIGRQLGHYQILRKISAGAMGEVYAAQDDYLKRQVAIKVLRPEFVEDPHRMKRFERETRAVASINHPHVVTVFSLEKADNLRFLIMELVDGETLEEVVRGRRLSYREVLGYVTPMVEGVGAAHEAGVVHRDLKPRNIMVDRQGRLKILDFGLALLRPSAQEEETTLSVDSATTRPGAFVGTPSYMSPEQIRGEDVDQRADIFALGIIMFELAAGHRPFSGGSSAETVSSILRDDCPPLSGIRNDLPRSFETTIYRCLAKDPALRFQTVRELAKELLILQSSADGHRPAGVSGVSGEDELGSPWLARPPASPWHARPLVRWFALLLGTVAVSLLWIVWQQVREGGLGRAPPTDFHSSALVTWPSRESEGRLSPNRQWVSMVSNRNGNDELWLRRREDGVAREAPLEPAVVASHVWSPDGLEIACLVEKDQEIKLEIIAVPLGRQPRVSLSLTDIPRAQRLRLVRWIDQRIYIEAPPRLWRLDLETAELQPAMPERDELAQLRDFDVRSDERRVAFSAMQDGGRDIWTMDLRGADAVRLTHDTDTSEQPFFVGPRGNRILYLSDRMGQKALWEVSLEDGEHRQHPVGEKVERIADVSADGTHVILGVIEESSNLNSFDRESSVLHQLTADSLLDFLPTVASEGELAFQRTKPGVAVGSSFVDSGIVFTRWRTDGLEELRVVAPDGLSPRLSSDGLWLAYTALGEEPRYIEIWAMSLANGQSKLVTDSSPQEGYLEFPTEFVSPNVAWGSAGHLYFVAADPSGGPQIMRIHAEEVLTEAPRVFHSAGGPGERLLDLRVHGEGERVGYVLDRQDVREVHDFDGRQRGDRVLHSESDKSGRRLHFLGWRTEGGAAIVLRSARNPDRTESVEILEVSASGEVLVAGAHASAFTPTARLDPERNVVYLTVVEDGLHNLVGFDFKTGRFSAITNNALPGTSYSGVDFDGSGRLFFSHQSSNSDLWLLVRSE